jgi:hypothetical protein
MRRLPLFLFLLLLFIPFAGRAQATKGTMTGRVSDTAGAVLQGAHIQLLQSASSLTSDKQGEFVIPNIAPGSYEVRITFVGFAPFSKVVTVIAGQTVRLDAVMQVASAAQDILVTATAVHGDAEAINRIDSSENILNVLTNDQIMSLPNADVADALGRLMGVTLERDEGEGKYVQIRGTEPRLSNTTIDGVVAPSPEATVNQIKLDTIPADLVESVEINKTLSKPPAKSPPSPHLETADTRRYLTGAMPASTALPLAAAICPARSWASWATSLMTTTAAALTT